MLKPEGVIPTGIILTETMSCVPIKTRPSKQDWCRTPVRSRPPSHPDSLTARSAFTPCGFCRQPTPSLLGLVIAPSRPEILPGRKPSRREIGVWLCRLVAAGFSDTLGAYGDRLAA